VFDLGSDAWISSVVLWQYENDGGGVARTGNEARTVEMRFSKSAGGPSFPAEAQMIVTMKNVDLHLEGKNTAQHFGVGASARFVQLRVTDNYFKVPGIEAGGDRVGIGEIRFNVNNGSGRTAVAGAPNDFELLSGTEVDPLMTPILSDINPWGLALDPENERIIWSNPTTGEIGWSGYGTQADNDGILFVDEDRVWHGIDLDCEQQLLFLLDSATDQVMVFDLPSSTLKEAFADKDFIRPNAIDYCADGDLLAISDSGNDFVALYRSGGKLIAKRAAAGAWGIAIDTMSDNVFYTSHDEGTLTRWNPSTNQIEVIASNLNRPRGVEIDRYGRIYCVTSGDGRIVEVNRNNGNRTPSPIGVAVGARDLLIFEEDDTDGDSLLDSWEAGAGVALCKLHADSNLDLDMLSVLQEMLFNGSVTEADGSLVEMDMTPEGESLIGFEGLADEGYAYRLFLSTDLKSWQPAKTSPMITPIGNGYNFYEYTIDPLAEGFAGNDRLYGRVEGKLVDQ